MDQGAQLKDALDRIAALQSEVASLRLRPAHLAIDSVGARPLSDDADTSAPSSTTFGDYELGLGLRPARRAVNVVIPMSGLKDSLFAQAGYRFPKPLINVVGRPILHWVLEALVLSADDTVWLPISDDVELAHGVLRHVRRAFPALKVHLVRLTMETCGWVETLAATIRQMPLDARGRRTLCVDCHTIAHGHDLVSAFRELPDGVGASFYCPIGDELDVLPGNHEAHPPGDADSIHPAVVPHSRRFSYVQLSADGRQIAQVREKVAISSNINIGAYGFPSASALLTESEALMDEMLGRQRADALAATEYHASALIGRMINKGKDAVAFHALRVDDSAFATVGSPEELLDFISLVSAVPVTDERQPSRAPARAPRAPRSPLSPTSAAAAACFGGGGGELNMALLTSTRRLRFCFDLDSTLLYWDGAANELTPVSDNIELVRALAAAGHYIILQTSAAMTLDGRAHAVGNVGRALASAGPRVFDALKRHEIPYDELHFGKPAADFYIDSITLNAGAGTLAKDLGWRTTPDARTIEGGIRARSFNQVALVGDKHVIKSSNRKQLAGEAFYYCHIPHALAHLFPELVEVVDRPEVDSTSIVQTRVNGATFSHMLINLTLTAGRLRLLLDALHALHSRPSGVDGETRSATAELCANYGRKVGARFHKHRALYDSFKQAGMRPEAAAASILDFLHGYEGGARCAHAWYIHGDPVFSNAILTKDGQVKMIDMRGSLGERLTTQGDCHYDLSKVYQSLCGYDFMLLDKRIAEGTAHSLAQLREVFWDHVRTHYPQTAERDIRLLTAAHFFSIVPLHEERDHQERYLRASESMLVVEGLL